jgi:hypothetical protein
LKTRLKGRFRGWWSASTVATWNAGLARRNSMTCWRVDIENVKWSWLLIRTWNIECWTEIICNLSLSPANHNRICDCLDASDLRSHPFIGVRRILRSVLSGQCDVEMGEWSDDETTRINNEIHSRAMKNYGDIVRSVFLKSISVASGIIFILTLTHNPFESSVFKEIGFLFPNDSSHRPHSRTFNFVIRSAAKSTIHSISKCSSPGVLERSQIELSTKEGNDNSSVISLNCHSRLLK